MPCKMRFEFYIQVPFLVILALSVQWIKGSCPVTRPVCNGSYPVKGPLEFVEEDPSQHCCSGGNCTAYIGGTLCLTCAAQNFCHINWVVNGSIPYPFKNYCNYCEFCSYNNHTLVIANSAFSEMKGNYTCELSNGTNRISRHFEVEKICDEPVHKDYEPKPHQLSDGLCVDTNASFGKNVTFYCEFCTKDKYNETTLQWMKLVENASMPSLKTWVPVEELDIKGTTFTTKRKELVNCYDPPYENPDPACRPEVDSVGSFLYIKGVTNGSLGQYKLVATIQSTQKTGETSPVTLSKEIPPPDKTGAVIGAVIGATVGFVLLMLPMMALWHEFNLDIKLMYKDRFGVIEQRGRCSYDAFIVYDSSSDTDRKFVVEDIKPFLEKNNCIVFVKDIDTLGGSFLAEELLQAMESSLRCILLVSSSFVSSKHTVLQVNAAIDHMAQQHTKIIPVLFGEVDTKTLDEVQGLGRLLTVLRCLKYQEGKVNKTKFLKRLLLRMPVKPKSNMQNSLLNNIEL